MFTFQIKSDTSSNFNASVHVELKGSYGFLSAADWPLLPVSFSSGRIVRDVEETI